MLNNFLKRRELLNTLNSIYTNAFINGEMIRHIEFSTLINKGVFPQLDFFEVILNAEITNDEFVTHTEITSLGESLLLNSQLSRLFHVIKIKGLLVKGKNSGLYEIWVSGKKVKQTSTASLASLESDTNKISEKKKTNSQISDSINKPHYTKEEANEIIRKRKLKEAERRKKRK